MNKFINERWVGTLSLVAAAVCLVVINATGGGGWGSAMGIVALLLVVAWWSFPTRRGPHIDHAAAQRGASADDVIVYWRPG